MTWFGSARGPSRERLPTKASGADRNNAAMAAGSSTSTTQDRVTAVRSRPHTVIASTLPLSSGMPCQHVLQAVSSFVLDVDACGNNASDQVKAIASKLADRIQSG